MGAIKINEPNIKGFSWIDFSKAIWYLMGEKRNRYAFLNFIVLIILFYSIIPPLILGKIVDFFTTYKLGQRVEYFYYLALFLGLSYSIISYIRLTTKKVMGDLKSEIVYSIKVKGFEKLLSFSTKWHDSQNTGEKVQRMLSGVNAIGSLAYIFNNQVLTLFTSIVGTLGVFVFINPVYMIFFIIYIVSFFATLKYFSNRLDEENRKYFIALEKTGGSYVEGLSNILTIKTLGVSKSFTSYVADTESLTKKYDISKRKIGNNLWKTFQILNGLYTSLFMLLVGRDVFTGIITPGTIVIFFGYFQNLRNSSGDFLDIYNDLLSDKSAIARMINIFWEKEREYFGNKLFPSSWNKIQLNNAGFSYKRGVDVNEFGISKVNLNIGKYQKIGIVGKTGSGKSTLSKLLAGLYKFDTGTYFIDDLDFYDIKYNQITNNIFLVLQESEMFNLSLKDNITLMRRINKERFTKAIELSQLTELINKLPNGIETLIGERGYRLSGGERQRIGIARAIYRNPKIFIFDEATSSLDSKTEGLIIEGLINELKDKTLISIAHRVTTLKDFDKIYVFKSGSIVESGSYEELSNNNHSHFHELYSTQTAS